MIELIVIIVLLIFIGVQEYFNRKERKVLLNAVLSKNTDEFIGLESQDKAKPELEDEKPDLIPIGDADDETFQKAIKNEIK